jgi:RNA polymerase sigma factor (sigma-70 family)
VSDPATARAGGGEPPAHAELLRSLAPRVLTALLRAGADFDEAEDATQEALIAAASQWRADGLPDNPQGWLVRVARRKLVDAVRADTARRRREAAAAGLDRSPAAVSSRDDSLELFLRCAHPSLPPAAAIALTLRAVGGLTTEEIARAFLVPEATMSQRITRAKRRLAGLDRPFATDADIRTRTDAVRHVLYLMFNEGYVGSSGSQLARIELSHEAIRLTRALAAALPDDPEVTGLLALMLVTDARREARTGPVGELVPLAEQDRSRWDRGLLLEGVRLATAALSRGRMGPYQVQAAIAVVHAQATGPQDTDWAQILALYRVLERMAPNPVVTLNRAVAEAMVSGPAAGLAMLDEVAVEPAQSHRPLAVRAHLQEMAGEVDAAVRNYLAAAARTSSAPERDYLTLRAARLRR